MISFYHYGLIPDFGRWKRSVLLVPLVFLLINLKSLTAQNIIPNFSFENHSALPDDYGQWYKCNDWDNVNGFGAFLWPYASPDYLHTSGGVGVDLPVSTFGTLSPHDGNAIMGLITYYQTTPDYREYLSVPFTEPMIIGNSYNISFWISNGESGWYCNGGCDRVGIKFSTGELTQVDHEPIGGTPHFEIPGIFWTDEWQQISFTFVADAAYDRLTLGNFYSDALTAFNDFAPSGTNGAYYFIDEMVVIPDAVTTLIDTTICDGEFYTLPDGTTTNAAGTYTVTLTGAGGADSIIITNLFLSAVYNEITNAEICEGENYILPDGSIVSTSGTYINNLFTIAGCDSTITTNLTVLPFFSTFIDTSICEGENYILPDGIIVTTAGIYNTTLISVGGCDSIITTTLTTISPIILIVDVEICSGAEYILPDGILVTVAGTYTSILTAVSGCDSTIITNLSMATEFNTFIDADICFGESYILPDGTSTSLSGTYITNFVAAGGCDSVVTTTLIVHENPVAIFNLQDFVCLESVPIILDATPEGGIYSGTGVSDDTFDPELSGVGGPFEIIYTVTDVYGCSDTINDFISVIQNFANAGYDTTINAGSSSFLHGDSGGNYLWSPPDGLNCVDCANPTATPFSTTTYLLISTDEYGCMASDEVTVNVIGSVDLNIPNAFSANNDGINDIYHIILNGAQLIHFSVYDRWGQLIYFTESGPIAWDGTSSGKDQEMGVYVYRIEYELNGVTILRSGSITLLR
ncbi:MAG: gliding motility-associated C-terminal domain-containing protein [Bacteroidetes bacterium]|nr:gliding motility-associated C-terminal domain-containing protein [Bacteroidota bacterium]